MISWQPFWNLSCGMLCAKSHCYSQKIDSFVVITAKCGCMTHWGRVTHIYVGKLTIIGSDNGLAPSRHQVINWTSVGILLNGDWEWKSISPRPQYVEAWHQEVPNICRQSFRPCFSPAGPPFTIGRRLTGIGTPMINLRGSDDRLRFIVNPYTNTMVS